MPGDGFRVLAIESQEPGDAIFGRVMAIRGIGIRLCACRAGVLQHRGLQVGGQQASGLPFLHG
ncbi:hypothetical protein AA042_08060 [Pseudomonas lundensis]|nr:hypothetical protein AA042_08060 [Pseudomonas lundensis]